MFYCGSWSFFAENTHFHGAALSIHNTKTLDPMVIIHMAAF
jgi:hypothetical protein